MPEKLLRAVALGDEHQATRFVLMGGHPGAHALVAVAAVARPLVTYDVYDAGEPFAYAVANTLAETTAQRVIVIDPRAVPTTEAIEALRVAVKPGVAVMPLTVSPDGTLESAGAGVSRPGAVPHRLLAEHPELDAPDQPVRVPLLTGRSFGIDVADYRRSGGLDALLFNDFDTEALSVRLAASGVATVLEPSARFWQSGREIAFSRRDTGGNEQVIRAATQEDTISTVPRCTTRPASISPATRTASSTVNDGRPPLRLIRSEDAQPGRFTTASVGDQDRRARRSGG